MAVSTASNHASTAPAATTVVVSGTVSFSGECIADTSWTRFPSFPTSFISSDLIASKHLRTCGCTGGKMASA